MQSSVYIAICLSHLMHPPHCWQTLLGWSAGRGLRSMGNHLLTQFVSSFRNTPTPRMSEKGIAAASEQDLHELVSTAMIAQIHVKRYYCTTCGLFYLSIPLVSGQDTACECGLSEYDPSVFSVSSALFLTFHNLFWAVVLAVLCSLVYPPCFVLTSSPSAWHGYLTEKCSMRYNIQQNYTPNANNIN